VIVHGREACNGAAHDGATTTGPAQAGNAAAAAGAILSVKHNQVRIVGGAWRSRRLHFTPRSGLRPTPDRVRETLFNWLGQDLTGKECLDLFAGSGALGFEAASRGARRVMMVERDAAAYKALEANRAALGGGQVELARAGALEFLAADHRQYDIVFLDPPFATDYWSRLWALLPPRLTAAALVYCESGDGAPLASGWTVWKEDCAGQVTYQLLKRI
jgi:16S rRNA (guanine(966)-N(2))-methyltransferase RsmD